MNDLLLKLSDSSRIDLIDSELNPCSYKIYSDRLNNEVEVLQKLNQIDNILIASQVKDIIKDMNLPFFIRGSAGGSFVLYILGFTDIDPVKYNITFERFINQFRNSLGDIDFDLPRSLRDDILRKVKKGMRGNLAVLCTKVYYKERSALREAIRQVCRYKKFIPKSVFEDVYTFNNFIVDVCNSDPQKVFDKAKELEGTFNYYSTHVGGIIQTTDKDKLIPKKGKVSKEILPLVCLDKNDIDKQRRFKIDLLSNTGLDIINMIYGNKPLDETNYPPDENVFEIIRKGDTIGIVYGESPLIRATFTEYHKKRGLNSIEDIAKCLAMIRPMCRQDNKETDLIFDDDWIFEISKVLQVDKDLADSYRKKLAKDDEDIKKRLLERISPNRLRQLMQIKSYGFCKAHAMNYANLVYCQAYAKYHKPLEFHCAVINTINGRIYNDWVYYYDALRRGIIIYADKPQDTYIVKNKTIRPKKGIQVRLKRLSINEEIEQFGGITTLDGIENENLVGCSRRYKDVTFCCELIRGELINVIRE